MSIWNSVGGDPVPALENDGDAANYRGEGQPRVSVDVATALNHHRLIRLAMWDDGGDVDQEVLLSAGAARHLAARLIHAAENAEART